MVLLQSGFIASEPGLGEPSCSKDISSSTPVPVAPVDGPVLAPPFPGGWGFGLATTKEGQVYAWGVNQATLLQKSGSADDGADPSTLDAVAAGVCAAAGGFDHALLLVDGKVFAFGPAFKGATAAAGSVHLEPVLLPAPAAAVAAGEHHSLVLTAGGDVYSWGSNREGQLGVGARGDAAAPTLVAGPSSAAAEPAARRRIVAIAAGARHSVAVNDGGQVLAWGWNLHGQCGTGESAPAVAAPALVGALGPLKVVAVSAGLGHTVAATETGDVYTWGLNADSQLGCGSTVASLEPLLVEAASLADEHVVKVAAGANHTLALTRSGKALAWGSNKFGQLGTGAFTGAGTPQPVAAPGPVTDLAAGWWHSLFQTA